MGVFDKYRSLLPRTFQVVHVDFQSMEEADYSVATYRAHRGKLVIKKNVTVDSIDELVTTLSKNIETHLVFSGKGILQRRTDGEVNPEEAFSRVIPQGEMSQFVVQTQMIPDEESTQVIFGREAQVEPLLSVLAKHKIRIASVRLSAKPKKEESELENTITRTAIEVSVGVPIQVESLKINVLTRHHKEQKQLMGAVGVIAFVLLGGTVVDHFVYNSLMTEHQTIQESLVVHEEELTKIQDLEGQLANRRALLSSLGGQYSSPAFLADRIAASVPKTIQLRQLNIHPQEGKVKEGKEIEYDKNRIQISGESVNSSTFNSWIDQLKGMNWIGEVQIIHYGEETGHETANFNISIALS